jgi:hypothetical protein
MYVCQMILPVSASTATMLPRKVQQAYDESIAAASSDEATPW